MRFLDIITEKSIPQWARCYYDYRTCKLIVSLGKKAKLVLTKIHDRQQSINSLGNETEQSLSERKYLLDNNVDQIRTLMIQANKLFFMYHHVNKMVVFLFSQMKVHELNSRLSSYELWSPVVDNSESVYLQLLANVFYEGKMLFTMCQLNLEAYKKIHRKHLKTFEDFEYFKLDSPPRQNMRIVRTLDQLDSYFDHLENIYLMKKEVYPKRARDQLKEQLQLNPTYVSIASYLFGMANGINISLVVIVIIIFSTNHITIDSRDQFKRDFPVWRGVSYIIMYMWMMALIVVIFQRNKINYQLILSLGKMSSSTFLLSYASVFSFIFMSMFLLYVMDISQIIYLGDGNVSPYLPLVVWGAIIGYMVLPLPIFNWEGRWTFFKRIFQTLISPIYGAPFYTIMIIEQLVSCIQPFQDIRYSICYYTTLDLKTATSQNECGRNLLAGELFGIVIFSYRFLQCLRVAWKHQQIVGTVEMYIAIRSILNIIILLVSYFSAQNGDLRILWYVLVGPIILYSYFVDLKYDWGLLSPNSQYPLLRQSLGYNQYLYYVIMVLNLAFRIVWVATLSPTILSGLDVQSFYFFYVIGSIEIVRRLFWNLLKMENRHIQNVESFSIKTDYEEKEGIVRKQVSQEGGRGSREDSLEIYRTRQQLLNIKNQLEIKENQRKMLKQFLEKAFEDLTSIEKSVDQLKSQSASH